MTHWALVDFEDNKSEEVKKLLKPSCKDWALALATALRGDQGAKTSKMAYILTPISGTPAQLERNMKARLNGTLGMPVQEKHKGGPPSFTKQNVRDIVREAIQSVVDTRQQNTAGGNFQDGVHTHNHAYDERTRVGPRRKPFSNVTKEKLMGLCMVTKWCNMPPIYTEIEGCKSDRDLRTILQTQWGKYKNNFDTMFYDIYWGEELIKTIWTADFTSHEVKCSHLSDLRNETEFNAADAEDGS